jgi:hypothetical protein
VAVRSDDGSVAWQLPWQDSGTPFGLLALGDRWIACDRGILTVDREAGGVLWERRVGADVATECSLAGRHVLYASRRCTRSGCTPSEAGAIDVETGAASWSTPGPLARPLVELDGDRVLVALATGIAILDARTGRIASTLALPDPPWSAEALPGGDLLVHGTQTTRIGVAPLAVKWQVPYAKMVRHPRSWLATKAEARTASAWLVEIEPASGSEHAIRLPVAAQAASAYNNVGIAEIVGTSPDAVDVMTLFAYRD